MKKYAVAVVSAFMLLLLISSAAFAAGLNNNEAASKNVQRQMLNRFYANLEHSKPVTNAPKLKFGQRMIMKFAVAKAIKNQQKFVDNEKGMARNRKLALWSMILGAAGVALLFVPYVGAISLALFPAALITGIIALSNVKDYDDAQEAGRGFAIAVVVLGGLGILILVAALIALATWAW